MLAVVHAVNPSSLTHSLQIYCIELIGPRSHMSWAWVEKRDLTIIIIIILKEIMEFKTLVSTCDLGQI